MSSLEDLADRVERLLLHHQELRRTNSLLEQELASLASERDSLRSRLAAARSRIDALLDRLPVEAPVVVNPSEPPDPDAAAADIDTGEAR